MSDVIPIERGTSDEESQLNFKFWNNSYPLPRFIILDFSSSPRLSWEDYVEMTIVHYCFLQRKLSTIYYPMVWCSNNSRMTLSTSASESVNTFDSVAVNTTFSILFTLVGEPGKPIFWASALISSTFHSSMVK